MIYKNICKIINNNNVLEFKYEISLHPIYFKISKYQCVNYNIRTNNILKCEATYKKICLMAKRQIGNNLKKDMCNKFLNKWEVLKNKSSKIIQVDSQYIVLLKYKEVNKINEIMETNKINYDLNNKRGIQNA